MENSRDKPSALVQSYFNAEVGTTQQSAFQQQAQMKLSQGFKPQPQRQVSSAVPSSQPKLNLVEYPQKFTLQNYSNNIAPSLSQIQF